MNQMSNNHEDSRLAEILAIIRKLAAGDLTARGTLAGDGSALDDVMAGINNLGESLKTEGSNLPLAKGLAERKAAEQELHSANEQHSVLLDSLPIAVYRCRADGDYAVQYMSQNVASFTGYTAGDFLAQSDLWFSHIHPDDLQRVSGEIELLLEKGRHTYEYRWRKADGNYLWIRDSLRLVRLEDDTPNYLVGMWQDITEDILAAEALRKANDDLSLFRKLLDSSSDAIEVIDPTTLRFLDVNETACRALGYSREELLALSVHDIDPNSGTDSFQKIEEQMRESGEARFETRHRRKDGSTFPVEVNMGAVTLDKLYGLGIVRDISERKQADQALEEAELRLKAIFDAALDGILVVDAQSQAVIMGNKAICDMLGYELEEFMRLNVADLSPVAARPEVQRQFARQAKGEILVAPELPVQRKDGSVFYADVSGGPLILLGGRSVMVGVVHDVTESKRAEEALRYKNTVLSILQRISPSAILMVNENARIVSYNQNFIQMWNLSEEMVRAGIDEPVLRKVCEQVENPDKFLARIKYLYEHKKETSHDELMLLDGRIIDRHSSPIVDDDGRYYGRVWDFRDITDLKRATEKVHQLNEELELKVQARTHQLLEAKEELEQHRAHLEREVARRTSSLTEAQRIAHLGNWEWDIVNDMLIWSDEIYRIFGLEPQQFDANYEAFLNAVHPQDRQLMDDSLREALARQHTYSIEHRILLPDGTLRHVHEQAEIIRGKDEQPISMLGTVHDITERKQAEQTLRDSESRYRNLIETTLDWVWEVDENAVYTYVSPRAFAIIGYQPEELIGKTPFDLMAPEEAKRVASLFAPLVASQQAIINLENTYIHKDGHLVVLETSGVPVMDAEGKLCGYRGLDRDITERKQAEQALRDSENRYRNIVETTRDWVWEVDENLTYTYVSPRGYAITGYQPAELIGKTPFDLMAPEEAKRVASLFAPLSAAQQAMINLENTRLHKDGHPIVFESSGVPVIDDEGKLCGYRGIDRDITERKLAQAELLESELAYRTLSQNLPGMVYRVFVREKGRMQFYNAMPAQMTGYAADELTTGTVCSIEPLILDEDRPGVGAEVKRAIAEKSAFVVEYRLKHKDGGIRWMSENGMPVYGPDGAPFYIDGVIFDITEQKQVEEQIRKLNEELEDRVRERTQQLLDAQEELVRKEKLALLGQVAGSVGHELRNPLGVMNNAIYFLQTVLMDADETTREYLEIIKTEIADADRIVSDLLDSVRTKPPHSAAISIQELINQTLRTLTLPATITVALDIPEALPPVRVDARQVQQVFRNLISNGMESISEEGVLTVEALENRQEGTVSVRVSDTGCGMPPEVLANVFQPLFTTKARGIGLGLVVVKNLVQANGGTIEVQSEAGLGSTFTIVLPVVYPEEMQYD
ncbi:PAS domain S-box protein [Geopsychrobacter electrodiphilus]|uniref:PAS domain S-box protein n=1 Tax=Geopsychrobacter electrodiphilus TaxID=225196 RepID=UPI000369AAE3|nr:PAS domain S-box protein [Geopsychrobacter electrodiphilus]